MGAAFMFRYQLYKTANAGATRLLRKQNWCCVTNAPNQVFYLPEDWVQNRNARRHLHDVLECERFRAIAMVATEDQGKPQRTRQPQRG